jgi:EAL domain-containing protein (putative c-di-GMP-specific phosphodiesterase class I)
MLQEGQCDSGQGYLFARPLDVQAAGEFLRDWRADSVPTTEAPTRSAF